MMTRPPAPDDRPPGRGQLGFPISPGRPGEDPLEAQRARLASLWALMLRRFRAYVHQSGAVTAGQDGHEEDR
jgi:hypothetical protein